MSNLPEKPKDKRLIYLDHAATTPTNPEVKKAMDPYFCEEFGNPSSLYGLGRRAKIALDRARKKVADILSTQSDTIFFTGGGTESINLAIFGIARKHESAGKHIITSKAEHHAVLDTVKRLEKDGFEALYFPVDSQGLVNVKDLADKIRPDTILISIMYANNEVGTVNQIAEIGREILKYRKNNNTKYPYFHTDACQAAGALDLNVEKLHVDLMTINGSKIYGPKGIGVLYKRRGLTIDPLIYGGGQEMKLRSGTENVACIIGFAKALELVQENRVEKNKRQIELRNYFWQQIQEKIEKVRLNGPELLDESVRLPNNLNISVLDVEGEALLLYLDEYGIMCSAGSACASSSLEPSHVLMACGLPLAYAHGSLRFTLGKNTTKEDIDYVMMYLPGIVEKLRQISPVNLKMN